MSRIRAGRIATRAATRTRTLLILIKYLRNLINHVSLLLSLLARNVQRTALAHGHAPDFAQGVPLSLSRPAAALTPPLPQGRIEQITGIPTDAQRLSVYRSAEEWEAEAGRCGRGVAGGAGAGAEDAGVLSVRSGNDEGMTLGDLGVGEFGVLRVSKRAVYLTSMS